MEEENDVDIGATGGESLKSIVASFHSFDKCDA
jgi:hypothetical protein